MRIGVPKEIKPQEHRVGLTPDNVRELVEAGHQLLIESSAGIGSGFTNKDYQQAGAMICDNPSDIFADAELIVKVKEPLAIERAQLHSEQMLFTYLHLAADRTLCEELLASGCTCISYETVTNAAGQLPLLLPMSEIAGRLSVQAGANALEKSHSGRGVLLSGVAGVPAAKIIILGAGIVGSNAAYIAFGMGAQVLVMDKDVPRLRALDSLYHGRIQTRYANTDTLKKALNDADLVICGALIPGAKAPKLIPRSYLAQMQDGAVIVDVAIDQGGCCESSTPTTHQNPTYLVDGIVHYCVANMPAAVARTSTLALNQVTQPYIMQLANHGLDALKSNRELQTGLNIFCGQLTHPAVAESLGLTYTPYVQLR